VSRTVLTESQVDALRMIPWHLHLCSDPDKGLAIAAPSLMGTIEALVALGYATASTDVDLVDLLESMETSKLTVAGSVWTLEFPGLELPPAPTTKRREINP
jgi:hypothetical protein